jgi:hypothetical protein
MLANYYKNKILNEELYIENDKLRFNYNVNKKTTMSTKMGKYTFVPLTMTLKENKDLSIYSVYPMRGKDKTKILKALKKKNNVFVNVKEYEHFIKRTGLFINNRILLGKDIDVIVTPQTSSYFINDLLDNITNRSPNIKIIQEAFQKVEVDKIKVDWNKYNIDDKTKKNIERELKKAKENGYLEMKNFPKQFTFMISNFLKIDNMKIKSKYVEDKNVVILDDIAGSGFTLKEMFVNIKLFSPANVYGVTMFKSSK